MPKPRKHAPKLNELAERVLNLLIREGTLDAAVERVLERRFRAPTPPVRGRRDWRRIGVTIDRRLYEALDAERARTGKKQSAIVEDALWRYFGRPILSFEDEGGEQP